MCLIFGMFYVGTCKTISHTRDRCKSIGDSLGHGDLISTMLILFNCNIHVSRNRIFFITFSFQPCKDKPPQAPDNLSNNINTRWCRKHLSLINMKTALFILTNASTLLKHMFISPLKIPFLKRCNTLQGDNLKHTSIVPIKQCAYLNHEQRCRSNGEQNWFILMA